ncbi:MAG TPA: hypothetical protein VJU02_01695 [Nitrospiraceae bacterium]|nr:hypothetical protein [Nitrospiraceae bacterium]
MHATSTPTEPIDPAVLLRAEMALRLQATLPLGRLGSHVVTAILFDQWINDQTAIETAQDDRARRHRRLPLLDHQAFAF